MKSLYDWFLNASVWDLIGGLIIECIVIRLCYEIISNK